MHSDTRADAGTAGKDDKYVNGQDNSAFHRAVVRLSARFDHRRCPVRPFQPVTAARTYVADYVDNDRRHSVVSIPRPHDLVDSLPRCCHGIP